MQYEKHKMKLTKLSSQRNAKADATQYSRPAGPILSHHFSRPLLHKDVRLDDHSVGEHFRHFGRPGSAVAVYGQVAIGRIGSNFKH